MSRSWDLRHCADCGRVRVHLRLGQVWKCIGKLKNPTRPCKGAA